MIEQFFVCMAMAFRVSRKRIRAFERRIAMGL